MESKDGNVSMSLTLAAWVAKEASKQASQKPGSFAPFQVDAFRYTRIKLFDMKAKVQQGRT